MPLWFQIFGFSRPEAISSSVFKAAKIVFWRSNVGPFWARPKCSTGHRFDVISGNGKQEGFSTCSTVLCSLWPLYIELQRQKSHTENTYGLILEKEKVKKGGGRDIASNRIRTAHFSVKPNILISEDLRKYWANVPSFFTKWTVIPCKSLFIVQKWRRGFPSSRRVSEMCFCVYYFL